MPDERNIQGRRNRKLIPYPPGQLGPLLGEGAVRPERQLSPTANATGLALAGFGRVVVLQVRNDFASGVL